MRQLRKTENKKIYVSAFAVFTAITINAQIGIGTTNPQATLHVQGTFKIADGSQGMGKVLTSDSAGMTSWKTASLSTNSNASFYQKLRNGDSVKIVFQGTSITYGYEVPGPNPPINGAPATRSAEQFPEATDSILQSWGYKSKVTNHGYPGDQTVQGLTRWPNDTIADVLFIEYSYNDMADYEGFGYTQTMQSFRIKMDTLIDRGLKNGSWVILLAPASIDYNSPFSLPIILCRQVIYDIGRARNLPVIDMALVTKVFGDNYNDFLLDGLHLSAAAYLQVGKYIADFLIHGAATTGINYTYKNSFDGSIHQMPLNIGYGLIRRTGSIEVDTTVIRHFAPSGIAGFNKTTNTSNDFRLVAQTIGIGTTSPTASSLLHLVSTTKGSIPFPVMTEAQKNAIASPAIGLHIYQSDGKEGVYVNKSNGWAFAY